MLLMERLADRLVLWGREFSLGLGSRQNSQFGFTKFSICAYKILNLALQNSQFVLTKFSICAYKILNVYGCERCKMLVVSGLLVIVLDYSSTCIGLLQYFYPCR